MNVTINNGGQLENVGQKKDEVKKLKELRFECSDSEEAKFELWINDSSLSYLSFDEMIAIKKAITNTLKDYIDHK